MEQIKILYIDDEIDLGLSNYLEEYEKKSTGIKCEEKKFNPSEGYKSLIEDLDVISSNVILIDSRLYENRNVTDNNFTGEEFKVVIKKFFPFIEVIVITQNEVGEGYQTLKKYDLNPKYVNASDYYAENLNPILEEARKNVIEFRQIAFYFEKNRAWDKALADKIIASIQGKGAYDELTKSDIDQVISLFTQLQEQLENEKS